jgi:hypothetical protein
LTRKGETALQLACEIKNREIYCVLKKVGAKTACVLGNIRQTSREIMSTDLKELMTIRDEKLSSAEPCIAPFQDGAHIHLQAMHIRALPYAIPNAHKLSQWKSQKSRVMQSSIRQCPPQSLHSRVHRAGDLKSQKVDEHGREGGVVNELNSISLSVFNADICEEQTSTSLVHEPSHRNTSANAKACARGVPRLPKSLASRIMCSACGHKAPAFKFCPCTGCLEYWYCDEVCRRVDWEICHRGHCSGNHVKTI